MRIETEDRITYVHSDNSQGATITVFHPKPGYDRERTMQPAQLSWASGLYIDTQGAADFAAAINEAVSIARRLNKEAGIYEPEWDSETQTVS